MLLATLNTLLLAASIGVTPVDVNQLDGQTNGGTLVSLAPDQVVVETVSGKRTFSTRELYSLTFPDASVNEDFVPLEDPVSVRFVDGSKVQATSFLVEAGRATVLLSENEPIRAASRSIHAVRFFKPIAELSKQWDEIESAGDIAGDVLVIRKTRTTEDDNGVAHESIGLDSLEGVLYEVTDEQVAFEFDGTRVDVPRHKVEGVIYFHRAANRLADPTSRVLTVDGSAWNFKSCELDGETLQGVSVGGVRLSLPVASITKIDFSVGNLVFLSDLQPDTFEWKSDLETPKTPTVVSTWYRLRLDEGFYGGPLLLDAHSYEKGLALHSRTKLSYRLTREFTRFAAIAGIDDRYRADGNVTLTISGDGKQLLAENLAGSKQVNIDLDLRGVRRLEILVDYGEDKVGYGDYLNLCNARLMK
ncbi:MAG: NPCBM/NEW2 domain-containing protein [Planctomycetota bacterium]|nr:NPCBM/NEW2 domain-containing protein [Planctomycetota bacterium]